MQKQRNSGLRAAQIGVGFLVSLAVMVPALAAAQVVQPAPDYAPVEDTTSFGGAITSHGPAMLSVETTVFTVDAETQWRMFNNVTTDTSLFDVSDLVLVRAVKTGETWLAREVVMVSNLVKDEGLDDSVVPSPNAVFSGQISAITVDSLTVQGMTLLVDSKTIWKADGAVTQDLERFDIGDHVIARGDFDGKAWKAASIELTMNNVKDEPPAQRTNPAPRVEPGPGDGDQAAPVTYSGVIQTFLPERIVLDNGTFVLTEATLWEMQDGTLGLPAMFGVGDTVEVSAGQDGELWVALRVTMLTDLEHT